MAQRKDPNGNEWMASGWFQVLPMTQGQWLWLLLKSATDAEADGGLDVLVSRAQSSGEPWFDNATGGLDAPVFWGFAAEGRFSSPAVEATDRLRRERCVGALTELGLDEPRTVADLAGLMAELGLCRREDGVPGPGGGPGERWRLPPVLPLPSEVLPMDPEWSREADEIRWQYQISAITGELAELFTGELGRPEEVTCSIGELSRLIDRDPEDVRHGLVDFAENPLVFMTSASIVTMTVDASDGPVPADPERLGDDDAFRIAFDWQAVARRPLRIHRLDPEHPTDPDGDRHA